MLTEVSPDEAMASFAAEIRRLRLVIDGKDQTIAQMRDALKAAEAFMAAEVYRREQDIPEAVRQEHHMAPGTGFLFCKIEDARSALSAIRSALAS